MDLFLDAAFGMLAAAWPPVRRAARRWSDPHAWAEGRRTVWTWLAALGLLLPLAPVAVGTVHFVGVAFRIAGDDLMFMLGILLFLPLAAFAVLAACILASLALSVAFWLLTGRPHAAVFAGGYLFLLALLSWPLFSTGLDGYGRALAGTTASALLLLLAYLAADGRTGRIPAA